MIRFLLDGQVVTTPDGWQEVQSKVKRDDQYNAVLIFQEANVQFTGDGYQYLYAKLLENYCNIITFEIQRSCDDDTSWKRLILGKIFVADVEFNERECKANAKLEDNSFFSLIKNNQRIKTALDTNLTKMGQVMTPIPIYEVDFYDVATNTNVVRADVPCARVYDAFDYIIRFMSDNSIGFASSLFDIGGKWEGLCVTTGQRIRSASIVNWEQMSFADLFKEVYNVTEPLVVILENPYGSPTLRIESEDYAYGTGLLFTLSDVYEVRTKVENAKLYDAVRVGSSVLEDTNTYLFPELIDYFGFKTEELFLQQQCNLDNTLDLSGNWVRSSNVIQKQLTLQDNDRSIFIVDTELSSTTAGRTTNTNTFDLSPGVFFYNDRLRNSQIMERWQGGLPASIAKYIAPIGTGLFSATKVADQTLTVLQSATTPITFTNEVSDPDNYYDGTDTFTAGVTALYRFRVKGDFTLNFPGGTTQGNVRYFLRVYDSTNVLKFSKSITLVNVNSANASATFDRTVSVVMNATDYAQVFSLPQVIGTIAQTVTHRTGMEWQCVENTIGGGTFEEFDPELYPILTYDFSYPLTDDDFETIIASPISRIQFNMSGQPFRNGWIKEITYNHVNKVANVRLITSRNGS